MFWALTSIRNVWSHPCGKRGQMEIELLLFFPSPGTSELLGRGWQGSLSFQKSLCKPPVPAVSTTGGRSGVAGAHQCDRGDTPREAWEGILGWNRVGLGSVAASRVVVGQGTAVEFSRRGTQEVTAKPYPCPGHSWCCPSPREFASKGSVLCLGRAAAQVLFPLGDVEWSPRRTWSCWSESRMLREMEQLSRGKRLGGLGLLSLGRRSFGVALSWPCSG